MAEKGGSRRQITEETGLPSHEVDRVLDQFLDHRWAIELDGKVLALSVPMDRALPSAVPASLRSPAAQILYMRRSGSPARVA